MANPYQAGFGAALSSAAGDSGNLQDNKQNLTFKDKKNLVKRLMRYLSTYKSKIVLIFILSFITVVCQLYIPIVIGHAIDCMVKVNEVDFISLKSLLIKLVFIVLIGCAAWKLQGTTIAKVAASTTCDLRVDAFKKLGKLPVSTIDSTSHGDLVSRVTNDVDQVGEGLLQALNQLFVGGITILGTLLFMVSISYKLALVVVILTPLSILVASSIAKYSHKFFASQMQYQGSMAGYANEMLANMDLVEICGYTSTTKDKYQDLNKKLNYFGLRAQFISSLSNPATRFVNNIIYATVAVLGFTSILNGRFGVLSVGQVQALLSYSFQYTKPFNEISATITQIEAAFASCVRLFGLLDEDEDIDTSTSTLFDNKPVLGEIVVDNVSFGYTPDKLVLKNISFKVKPGQKVAIVGATGCGKTTLMNLIMRYYDPSQGTIYLDGVDITTIPKDVLRKHLGIVLQSTWLFEGSVLDNLVFGAGECGIDDVQSAASRVRAHEFISHLEHGYDTYLEGETAAISKGQRQLLCVSRTMLKNPEVLLLDEATSSIDSKTEQDVQRAFDEMVEGRTSIIVAHRLSTIQNADLILVMDKGEIKESGTHTQLLKQNGLYAQLCRSSF